MSTLDTDAIAERALGCWERAARAIGPIELYVRVSDRRRVEHAAVREIRDAGVAVRAFLDRDERAGFAAGVGFSDAAITRAARMAGSGLQPVVRTTPEGHDASRRWSDVDPPIDLPAPAEMDTWRAAGALEWIEAGTTSEVLIGPAGWVATRRRHRIWARTSDKPPRLVARRVTSKWDQFVAVGPMVEISPRSPWVALLPEALAPIVPPLLERCAEKLPTSWWLTDEPCHPDGLVGGSFDDAGFETCTRQLRQSSRAGFFQRRSFRDPPSQGLSNLVLHATDQQDLPKVSAVVTGSRVVALGPDDWVVEFDLKDHEKRRVRSTPSAIAASLGVIFGSPQPTAEGPIVPGAVLDTQILAGERL